MDVPGDAGRAGNGGASETQDHEVAPPYTTPAWMDTDLGELLDGEPPSTGELAAAGEENDEALVAFHVELAMRHLQHHQGRAEPDQEEDPFYCFGSGDATLYAIEDGVSRLMIGRGVGRDGDGCVYCLVGSTAPVLLAMLDSGEVAPAAAFDDVADLTLCSVFQDDQAPRRHFSLSALNRQVSNIVLLQRYKSLDDVPLEYRPGHPFLHFADE